MYVGQTELSARRPYVPFLIVESFGVAIDTCHHCIRANIEFSSVIKKRVVNIFLNNACSLPGSRALLNDPLDFVVFLGDLDSLSAVRIFSRLDDPHVQLVVILSVFIVVMEILEVGVGNTIFHVEGHR